MAFIWAFISSYVAVRLAKPVACKAGLVDKPNERKLHKGSVPLVGGISIFIGVVSSIVIFLPSNYTLNLYLVSALIILLLGVIDDKHDLRVSYRIIVQSLSACIMIFGSGMYISYLGPVIPGFDVHLGSFGIVITVVAVIASINAFNMVDGIDGLAGMISIVSFLGLAVLFGIKGNSVFILPVLFVSAICAYLTFNLGWPNRTAKKVFMGDAGSMFIGLTVVWLLVYGTQGKDAAFRPVIALWVIALPLMDMVAIMIRRLRKGQSPFKPDRNHLHHIFMRAGLSARQSLVAISFMSLLMVSFGVFAEVYGVRDWLVFCFFIITFLIYSFAIQYVWKLVKAVRKVTGQ
ncbi:UDP-N-acetylglucosamine--undecaprenyl-phosphate N-acetylglucosaminephosphotransferase [Ferrimonas kyonanensis]|uniref:UDP-N-acetylglucosamine--undecaprenyl-phosphate N-acetylglucosaminephosphotransferase n=1 Tax=Ferrimonas kyonanensis TaxID=364763 RepID=UPI001FE08915|nr:UDP-N-acetylglucosamine--undecaprenyl-phosphate N-acetylglucosaminephosphotransferase [Ferrimonas kyonanensis]